MQRDVFGYSKVCCPGDEANEVADRYLIRRVVVQVIPEQSAGAHE